MKKYLLSIICTLLPIFASAQEPYAIMIDENTAIEFRYDNDKDAYRDAMDIGPFSDLTERPWTSLATSIYSVVFDPSFANYTSLSSTATWFANCRNLETIIGIEYLNTSNVTDMHDMFLYCANLTSIDVSHFDTRNVTNMGNLFDQCMKLSTIDVSSFNTSSVTRMTYMFNECKSLTNLDISNFNTSNVHSMKNMFSYCSELKTIYVGNDWDTSKVTEYSEMFTGCTSLVGESGTTYDSNHTDVEYARVDMASSPGYLTYKNNGGSGGSSEEAQYWQELESTLQYADDVYGRARDNSNVEPWMLEELSEFMNRGSDMLDAREADEQEVHHMVEEINWICWEIEEAMNRNPDEPSGEAEPYAVLSDNNTVLTFYYDDQIFARGGMEISQTGSEVPWSNYRESIYSVIFDESFANCMSITRTANWFSECTQLKEIIGLSYLNTLNVIDMSSMFYGCSGLTTLDLSNFDTSNVTDIRTMFYGCSGLTTLDLSNFNTSNITDLLAVFYGCSGLTTLDLSNFNTTNVTNMEALFEDCSSLTTLDLSNLNTSNVINMGWMFFGCTNLTTIYVRSGWSTVNVSSSNYMFFGCERLVGGRGTQWSQDHINAEYAHIDGGVDNPGYLTDKGESEAWFDGLTAWVYGDATLDDAFAEVGREEALKTIAAIVWEGDGALTAEQMQGITNPNLLVYVNEASKAPAGVQNVIVNGTAAQIVLTDASGNNNFHCPQPFTAQSISYTRNFSQTTEIGVCRGWETIALPFNVQSISHSHGALVPFGGGNGGYPFWLHQLQDNSLSPVTVMEANTPYLICMPNNKVYPSAYNQAGNVTFASSNVTVPETHPHEGFAGNVMLIPAFQSVEASPDIYTLNVGEASGSYAEGSVFISNYRSVRPFQAYTVHTNGARGEDIRYIPLSTLGGGTDGTTGIMEILQPAGSDAGAWYSLDGRKLDAKPTRKGVYIQNGKKIVIK